MADQLIEFMVMTKNPLEDFEPLGSQKFRVAPRVGEYVTINENGVGQAYRVKAVIHPLEPAGTAGDLVLEHVGTDLELRMGL